MKNSKVAFLICLLLIASSLQTKAQCSLCTKTSMQQGEKAGEGMNTAIIYLMLMPLGIMGLIGYKWWKQEKKENG